VPLLPGENPQFHFERRSTGVAGVGTAQGSGPEPDDNITNNATATQEFEPKTSPVVGANRIAFVSNGDDADGDGFIDATPPADPTDFELWLMRPDGTQQQRVVPDRRMAGAQRDPAFDPSGRLLAYASDETGTYQIYTIEITTRAISRITTTAGNKRHPTWSGDSNWIAFQCDRNGNWDIYKVPSNAAGAEVQLTFSPEDETSPAWSPTTPFIAYQAAVGNRQRIYSMDTEGGNVTALTDGGADPNADDIDPAWRPTGQSIAFSSSRLIGLGDTINDFNIWTMSAMGEVATSPAALITSTDPTDTYQDTDPTWTPDLTERARMRLVFESDRPANAEDTSEPDIWATFIEDSLPPVLVNAPERSNALPWLEVNGVELEDVRYVVPDSDVTIKIAVYDKDTGVDSVSVLLKDPDIKIFDWAMAWFEASPPSAPDGWQALERDCAVIDGLSLYDDGVAPDEVANDGIYTGTYTTLPVSRDYIIDIAVTDAVGNSMVYDDIYGFSTITFDPNDRALFVDDYCEGQAFIYLTGVNNDWPAQFPVESYYRCNPGFLLTQASSVDFDSIIGWAINYSGFGAGPSGPTTVNPEGYYDVWRILCRGPIPDTILRGYLPTVEYQLSPEEALSNPTSARPTRAVLVANRAVIWAAPHTGDVWIANGTIMDASTQAQLAQFLDQGGRLFISGEDLAWALTMGGRTGNNFLSSYLRAQYASDVAGGDGFTAEGNDDPYSPVSWDAWTGTGATHIAVVGNWWDTGCNPLNIVTPTSVHYQDAADHIGRGRGSSVRADGITPIGDVKLYGYGGFGGTAAGTCYSDPLTGAHVAYLAFGFEDIYRRYWTGSTPPPHCHNHRSHLFHNFLCWARTGAFQGRVVSISEGGKPVTDPEPIVLATQGALRWAVRCQKDGTYVMQGLKSGQYSLSVIHVGYEIDHSEGEHCHGGWPPVQVDFAIKEAQPGAIAGIVTSAATGEFIPNVTVRVYLKPPDVVEEQARAVDSQQAEGDIPVEELGDPIGEGITAADGTFVIPEVPVGDFIVVADGTAVGYGTQQLPATVTPGNTTNLVFQLPAADGTLDVHVTDAVTGNDLQNATVSIFNEANQLVATDSTDLDGMASFSLPAGNYRIRVQLAGYETPALQPATVTSLLTTTVEIQLNTVPPGSISGRVVSASNGNPVGGIRMRVLSGGAPIAGVPDVYTTDTLTDPGDGTPSYNYFVPDVPAGEVTVRPIVTGYQPNPAERVETVASGQTTSNVSFTLESLHVFPVGLQLISLPWDFSAFDPAVLLGVNVNEFRMATWESSTGRYRVYPNAPADRFRLGTGYWMNLTTPADLAMQGTAATAVYELPLAAGWNLIGDPYQNSIDFYAIGVREADGVVRPLQEALARNVLGSGLFAYMFGGYRSVAALAPFTGYWLLANESCSLVIDGTADSLGVAERSARPAVAVPADGWLLQLQATLGNLQDTSAYIGAAGSATDGFDPGLDQGKPPAPIMAPYVYVALQSANATGMAVDIRETSGEQRWDIEVQTNLSGQPVEISWPDMSSLPPGVRPILTDLASGRQVYMRTSRAYAFEADTEIRKLRVSISAAGAGQLAIMAATASARAENVAVTYTLSKSAQVTIEVRNISGRLIRCLTQDQVQTAGLQTAAWDGRNGTGAKVPNGRYLVTITGRTEDGQQAQALTQVTVVR